MLTERKQRKAVLKSGLTLSFMEESFKAAVFRDHMRAIGLNSLRLSGNDLYNNS